MFKKLLIVMALVIVGTAGLSAWWQFSKKEIAPVTNTENVGNEMEKQDLIRITSPRPNQTIESPLVITGEARGNWFYVRNLGVIKSVRFTKSNTINGSSLRDKGEDI